MPSKSIAPSQLASGVATPRHVDDSVDSSYSSPLFSAVLQDRLRQLDIHSSGEAKQGSPGGEKHHSTYKNALVHSIEVLAEDRRKTSELAREQALGNLLRIMVMKYDPFIINYDLFTTIIQSYTSSRTEVEASTALQLICVCTTMLEESDDPRSGDCFDMVNNLRGSLLKRLDSTSSLMVKQAIVTSFAVLTYFMHAGGGGYGMEKAVSGLLEVAEGVSDASESPLAASSLAGAALLTTLLSPGSAEELASDWLYSFVPMLELADISARLAAVKFVAVLFEISNPTALFEGENGEASEQIMETLEQMSQESISRTAKRDKKIQNLLVKSVLKTGRSRQELAELEGKDEEEHKERAKELVSDLVLQYHKHTLSKSLGINTWVALIVVEHLGWVFGPGLHIQLASNPYIKSLLKKEEVKVENSLTTQSEDNDGWREQDETPRKSVDQAKKSQAIRKRQIEKAEERGLAD